MGDNWEFWILWPLAVPAAGLALIAIAKAGARILEGTQSPFLADYTRFMKDCSDRGLDYAEAIAEWHVRQMMVRLRRDASDAVRADPVNWKTHLDRCVDEAFKKAAAVDPDLLPAFAQMLKGQSYAQILYPAEARLVDRDVSQLAVLAPSVDERSALRVVRSA